MVTEVSTRVIKQHKEIKVIIDEKSNQTIPGTKWVNFLKLINLYIVFKIQDEHAKMIYTLVDNF